MDASGQLNEYTERKEMSNDVVSMSLGTVPPGEQRSRFLAVGLADQTVRIISLDPAVSDSYILPSKFLVHIFFLLLGHSSASEYASATSGTGESVYC